MANEPTKPTQEKPAGPRWRWLTNNQERVLGFAMPPVYSEQAKASTPDSNVLTLPPGASLVEVKRWEALKAKDPPARVDGEPVVGAGEIERLLTTKIPKASHRSRQAEAAGSMHLVEGPLVANKAAPLDGIPEADAVGLVEEIRDVAMVRALIHIERRPAVNEALHRVLDVLTKGTAKTAAA